MTQLADQPSVAEMEAATPSQLDALPYGMIQLDLDGVVLRDNKTEAELARLDQRRQIGRNFFTEVAPCTKVRNFYGLFKEGVDKRHLYEIFNFVFKFEHGWREVRITMMFSETTNSIWVVVAAQPQSALST